MDDLYFHFVGLQWRKTGKGSIQGTLGEVPGVTTHSVVKETKI